MDQFEKLFKNLLKTEGGYVDHPEDHGGPTKYGITLRTLTNYLAREVTASDVEQLTERTAREIYYSRYWIKPRINELPSLLQPVIFDMVVNMGNHGIKILQTTLADSGYQCGRIDGRIGDNTLTAAQAACNDLGNELIRKITRRRVIYYEGLVKTNETQRKFLAGWINRAESFLPDAAA